jgi:hypothetical protein
MSDGDDIKKLLKEFAECDYDTVWFYRTQTHEGKTLLILFNEDVEEIACKAYMPINSGWRKVAWYERFYFESLPKAALEIDLTEKEAAYLYLVFLDSEHPQNMTRPGWVK